MASVKLGELEYQVFLSGNNQDGSPIYKVRANYGWKQPYLKDGSPRFKAVIAELKKVTQQ